MTSKVPSRVAKLAQAVRSAARAVAPAAALLLVGVAAFALLKWVPLGSERDPRARGGKDELAIWQLLIAGEVVVWALFAAMGFRMLKTLRARLPAALLHARWRETAEFLSSSTVRWLSCSRSDGWRTLRARPCCRGNNGRTRCSTWSQGSRSFPSWSS